MAEQNWLTPAEAPAPSPYQNVFEAPASVIPAYDLRPLTLGELLDRTFSLYRSRFWLFAGIAAVSGGTNLLVNLAQLIAQHFFWKNSTTAMASIERGSVSILVLVVYFLAYSVTQAATVFAMSEVYLGRTATIGGSLRATASRWYAYMAIALWQSWSLMWVPLLLIAPAMVAMAMRVTALMIVGGILIFLGFTGGMAFGIICYLRNSLAIQATVVEGLKIRASMRRSKVLSSGAKWRVLVVFLISFALYLVFGVFDIPLGMLVIKAVSHGGDAIGAQASILLIGFLGHTLVSPVALIGLSLVYFDQRVRKEAFDIAVLLGEPSEVVFPAAVPSVMTVAQTGPVAEMYAPYPQVVEPERESEARATDDSAV